MRYRLTSSLPVPIERAFDFSVDPRNAASVHGFGTTITKVTEGEIGLGTVYRYDRRGTTGWMVVEIVEYDRPHAFTTTARVGSDAPQMGKMTFVERDGVTTVASEGDFQLWPWLPGWVRRLFTPICLALTMPMLWVATRAGERVARRALLR